MSNRLNSLAEQPDGGGAQEGGEGPFTRPYPWAAAFIGCATVWTILPPRADWEGPILVLDDPQFEIVRGSYRIPTGAAGVMAFDAGDVILKEPLLISTASPQKPDEAFGVREQGAEPRLGYAVRSPIVYERFNVLGKRFGFVVRAGQPGWKVASGPIRDDATAAYLNMHLA